MTLSALIVCAALAAPPAAQTEARSTQDTAVCRGLVVDENGAPVAGAAVAFVPHGEHLTTAALLAAPGALSDDDGIYELRFDGAPWGRLVVAKAGRQTCALKRTDPLPVAVMLPGGTLYGRLRQPSGEPVSDALVVASSPVPGNRANPLDLYSGARSDEKGIFSIAGVPLVGMKIRVEAPGFYASESLANRETPLDLTLEPYRGWVRGRVLAADGDPISDARVSVTMDDGVAGATTDIDGSFEIGVPRAPLFCIRAETPSGAVTKRLQGPVDGLELRFSADDAEEGIRVRVTDAATGLPIETFMASASTRASSREAQMGMIHHLASRRRYEGPLADLPVAAGSRDVSVFVEAEGHGWAHASVPWDHTDPFEIALGPEASITGTVVDSGTGEPVAGAAVRALPEGNASGGGQAPSNSGVRTDGRGRFTIRGQRPGRYHVQAHAPGHEASAAVLVEATADGEPPCRIVLPEVQTLRFRIDDGPLGSELPVWLDFDARHAPMRGEPGYFRYFDGRTSVEGILARASKDHSIGPLRAGVYTPRFVVPSCTQLGHALAFSTGQSLRTNESGQVLAVPEILTKVVRGRVALPTDVPTHRVALTAQRMDGPGRALGSRWPALTLAPLAGDGSFALDLEHGTYGLGLADLESGIVFHVGSEPLRVDQDSPTLELEPEIHWLRIDFRCEASPHTVALVQHIDVTVPVARGRTLLLEPCRRNDDHWSRRVDCRAGISSLRWIVPPGPIQLTAVQDFSGLWERSPVPTATNDPIAVEITDPEQTIALPVAAPPPVEELETPRGGRR